MKKHPVDDLFKRKLEGMQRTPSENAWLRIQEKQPVPHRPAVWGWYAAAGIAAAVMGGYLVWQNQQAASPGIHARHTVATVQSAPQVKQPEAVASVERDQDSASRELNNLSEKIQPAQSISRMQIAKTTTPKPAPVQPEAEEAPSNDNLNTEPAPVVAITEKPSVPLNTLQPEPIHNPASQGIKTLPDEPAVSQVNKPETEPTRTIVVAVETGDDESEEKPRNTRFARVFRQLKNARAGEKVDWEEVGFNPKNLVARVDDRLRSKDDKKDHPKEKTKL